VKQPVVLVHNPKGGVGKSTTTVNLASSIKDLKVLVVDFDGQASITRTLCNLDSPISLVDVFAAKTDKERVALLENLMLQTSEGWYLIPANDQLAALDVILRTERYAQHKLKPVMQLILDTFAFDMVLIDCSAGFSLANDNAMLAASHVVIPVMLDPTTRVPIEQLMEQITAVNGVRETTIDVIGCIETNVDRTVVAQREHEQLAQTGINILGSVSHRAVVPRSWESNTTVISLDPLSQPALAYQDIARKLVKVLELDNKGEVTNG